MNIANVAGIASPRYAPTDLHYEDDCRAALEPGLRRLLDMAEQAGWDRRKAAYTIMFLAAGHVTGGASASQSRLREPAAPATDRWRPGQTASS